MSWTSGCEIIILILYTVKYKGTLVLCCMTFPKQLLPYILCQLGNFSENIIYRFLFLLCIFNEKPSNSLSPQICNGQIYYTS